MPTKRRVGVLTGGGDAPGLNAVIRAIVKSAAGFGFECIGLEDSFDGLIEPDRWRVLQPGDVTGILRIGGTILGTTNRGDPFAYPGAAPGAAQDYSARCLEMYRALGLHGLVVIGGDGTLTIAEKFSRLGMSVVGVPKTIDNDIVGTNSCFGFDTAVSFACDAIDRLHTTAESHRRVMVVEVMGRYSGWIALYAGLAGGADGILIPEIPFSLETVADRILERDHWGARFSIVVVAEGAAPVGGSVSVIETAHDGHLERLGGIGAHVATQLQQLTGKEARWRRAGTPAAGGSPDGVRPRPGLAIWRQSDGAGDTRRVRHHGGQPAPELVAVPLASVVGQTKKVPLDLDVMQTARATGVSFGD